MSRTKETWILAEAPIRKAVVTLAIPTIITQLINVIYNLADTWFVGRTGDPAAVAAVSVTFPVFVLLSAVANLFGVGGASVISRSLGEDNAPKARKVFAFSFFGGLLAAFVFGVLILLFRGGLAHLIGATDDSYQYVKDYLFWAVVIGAVPTVGNVLCGHLVRSIGAAKEAGLGMSLGGLLNIALDPLFMFVILPPGHEVQGAAVATMLSNTAALLFFLIFLRRRKEHPVFTTDPRDISFGERIPSDVLLIGLPAAMQTTLAMVSNIFANALIKGYGTAAVAGLGVAKKINTIAFNTTMGLTQGVLPLIGFSYGAKNYRRMRQSVLFTGAVALVYTVSCTVCFRVFAPQLVRFFIDDAASVQYGTDFLRIIAFATPMAAFCYLAGTCFQATGKKAQSFVLSVMRKGVVDIPFMFVFRSAFGIMGILYATPFAEVVSITVAALLLTRLFRSLEKA